VPEDGQRLEVVAVCVISHHRWPVPGEARDLCGRHGRRARERGGRRARTSPDAGEGADHEPGRTTRITYANHASTRYHGGGPAGTTGRRAWPSRSHGRRSAVKQYLRGCHERAGDPAGIGRPHLETTPRYAVRGRVLPRVGCVTFMNSR